MSIYIFSKKINKILEREIIHLELPEVVAYSGSRKLTLKNYEEDKLQKFCESNKNVKIHPYFWNHNYCVIDMLDDNIDVIKIKKPDTITLDIKNFNPGMLIMILSFYNAIYLTYALEKEEEYKLFLNKLNTDRTIFSQFLIENRINLPVTPNYLLLIKRIFTNNNILEFVFNEPLKFDYEQIALILSHFDYGSINEISTYIFNASLEKKDKLLLCQMLIKNYEYDIDSVEINYLDKKLFKPYLNYYLYTMNIEDDLVNIYYQTWEIFLYNNGASKLVIMNDDKLNENIQKRYNTIKDNFNL